MLKNSGNKTAIAFGDQKISYHDLFNQVEKFATLIPSDKSGHMVIFSENRPGWIYAFYAVWKVKGVAIPIDYLATASEVAYILKDSGPSVIFCSRDKHTLMSEAIGKAGISPEVIIIDDA
jgi:long-chain acyl-CoA synthetase